MDEEELDEPEIDENALDEEAFDDEGEMAWESAAREAIENALDEAEHDEIRGVIYVATEEDQRGDSVLREYGSIDELLGALTDIGEEGWYAYVPYDGGPVFPPLVDGIAYAAVVNHGVLDFFEGIKRPEDGEELGTAHDLLLPGAGLILRVDLSEINDELIRYLAKHPEKMHDLTSRKFEELIAALFRAKGYDVVLTPSTRDGGVDIRAFQRNNIGTFLTLIECKRHAPQNRVSVDVVRGLYGVTESERANAGLIVTTSSFTKDAKSFRDQNKYRIHLADNRALQQWLNEHSQ